MMVWINLFSSILIPCLIGYVLLSALIGRRYFNLLPSLAISFGLGLGILTQCMLLLGILGIKYSVRSITFMLITIGVLIIIFFFVKSHSQKNLINKSLTNNYKKNNLIGGQDFLSLFLVAASIILMNYYTISIFWKAVHIPVYAWDSIATTVYNAKVLAYEQSLTGYQYFVRANYPLHMPMILTWISLHLGGWDDQLTKIVFPLMFISFIIIFNYFLCQYTSKKWALLGTFMLFSSNLLVYHASISYRDVFMIYYNCSVIMFLLIWKDQKPPGFLLLASLFAGIGTFTKLEGTAYFVIYCLTMIYILCQENEMNLKTKLKSFFIFFIPAFCICLIYFIFKSFMGVSTGDHLGFHIANSINNIGPVLAAYLWAVFLTANWNIIWVVLLFSIIFNFQKIIRSANIKILLITLVMFFGMHITIAITSGIGSEMIHTFTISRIILHFFPLSILLIILINSPQHE